MRWRPFFPMAGATAMLPLAVWWAAAPPRAGDGPVDRVGARATAMTVNPSGLVGSGSCSGRGCHGKVAPPGTIGSEYHTWTTRDPHAGAFLVLFDCRSESIQRHLAVSKPEAEAVPAFEDPLCMSCHGRPEFELSPGALGPIDCATAEALGPVIGPSGVGCEDCHGPAEPWLDVHYRPDWPDAYPEAAEAMLALRPAASKAEVCLRCHVGDGLDREVNHDLIAAGHPRLNFELTLFSDRMPTHWDEADTAAKRRSEGLPERDLAGEWAVGQVATLRATLDLLAQRADPPQQDEDRSPPWPEFAEYSCFACHHDLKDGGLHYSGAAPVPGSLTWASWPLPLSRALLERTRPELLGPIDALDRLMGRPFPDQRQVAEHSRRLSNELDDWLSEFDEGSISRDDLRALLSSIATDPDRFRRLASNWDSAAQLQLAGRAWLRSEAGALARSGDLPPGRLERLKARFDALDALSDALAFPVDHPGSPGAEGEPDPQAPEPDAIVAALRALLDDLAAEDAADNR